MFKKLIAILAIWLMSCVAFAEASPLSMLQSTTDQVLASLQAHKATLKTDPKVVYNIVNQILLPHVDIPGMSRSVLGRNVWNGATDQQRNDFSDQFTQLLIHTYSSALASYQDQTVKFFPLREKVTTQTRMQVQSQIIQEGGPPISVNYRLILLNNEWKVYDFSVDGVSMLESFRSQFATELSNGNLDTLIKHLTEHNINPNNSNSA